MMLDSVMNVELTVPEVVKANYAVAAEEWDDDWFNQGSKVRLVPDNNARKIIENLIKLNKNLQL